MLWIQPSPLLLSSYRLFFLEAMPLCPSFFYLTLIVLSYSIQELFFIPLAPNLTPTPILFSGFLQYFVFLLTPLGSSHIPDSCHQSNHFLVSPWSASLSPCSIFFVLCNLVRSSLWSLIEAPWLSNDGVLFSTWTLIAIKSSQRIWEILSVKLECLLQHSRSKIMIKENDYREQTEVSQKWGDILGLEYFKYVLNWLGSFQIICRTIFAVKGTICSTSLCLVE